MIALPTQLHHKIGGLGIAALTHVWMGTLDFQGAYYDPTVDPVHPDFQGPVIFVFWHEYIPFLFYLRGHSDTAMLLSQHHDAEWLSQAARHMGFGTIRGSTTRGGVTALRQCLAASRGINLAITSDGPRGPRRKLAQGCVFLSSRLQIPLVLVGLGYDRPWRLPTWDRFAAPRLFSRARGILSPRIQIPADIDRDAIEHYRQQMEHLLNELTSSAEDWAERGYRIQGQIPARRQAMPLATRRRRVAEGGQFTDQPLDPPSRRAA